MIRICVRRIECGMDRGGGISRLHEILGQSIAAVIDNISIAAANIEEHEQPVDIGHCVDLGNRE